MSDFMNYVIQCSQRESSLKNDKYYKLSINECPSVNRFFTIILCTPKTTMTMNIVGR